MNDDCLFCKLYREGDHVASTEGFVAIRDINPQADTHLLVLPERHIESFHEIGEFPPTRPSGCSTSSPKSLQTAG